MAKEWTISFKDDDEGAIGVFVTGNTLDQSEAEDDIIYVDGVKIQFNAYIKKIEETKDPLQKQIPQLNT